MKKLILIFAVFAFGGVAYADDSYVFQCIDQAKTALAAKKKVPLKDIVYYNGGLIGDGVSAIESIALRIKDVYGFYILNLELDDCSVFLGPKHIDN